MGKLGKIKGKLRLYIKWPLYLTLLLLVAGLGVYLISPQAGLLMAIVIIIYAAIAGGLYVCFLHRANYRRRKEKG